LIIWHGLFDEEPACWRAYVYNVFMRFLRIAWLIAGTLLVARITKALLGYILWYGFDTTLWLPGRSFAFVPYLNGAALLAVSFALVSTCAWLIERRFSATRN
jgi:hypothetical protein